jgi:hypothetical protein
MVEIRAPKVVFLDIETLPDLIEVLKIYPRLGDYPGQTLKATITSIICFGYALLDDKTVHVQSAWDYPDRWQENVNDDFELCKFIYELLKDADAVVTHNGKRFDWRFIQTRLMKHKLPTLPKINHIDTCELAKRNLYLFNNRLGTLGKFLTDEDKMENGGWDLWVNVHRRQLDAMELMVKYCRQDVALLRKVFQVLRPFATNMPNHNLYAIGAQNICPSCGSTRLHGHGYHVTKTNSYHRYRCQDCGSVSRTNVEDKMPRTVL